jgi:hypothetical protein
MIVVHVNQTWPLVEAARMDQDDAVLGVWPIAEDKLAQYGDVLLAVYDNKVVAVYDIEGHTRGEKNKVTFVGHKSQAWAHVIGQPNPAKHWGQQGDAWPLRYIDTEVITGGDVPVQETPQGQRAVVNGITLTVGADGNATVILPAGRTVTVLAA